MAYKITKIIIMNKQKTARVISEMFNGFATTMLSPILAILFSSIHLKLKITYTFIHIILPILVYQILKKLGKVSDYELTKREERPIYYVTMTLLYAAFFFVLRSYNIETVTFVSLALLAVSTVITIVTFAWKISGHMAYSTLLFCTLAYLFSPYFFLMFLFTPLIAWSRVELKKHTWAQTVVGTLLTFAICATIYWGLPLFR